jgi:hypothetical protein
MSGRSSETLVPASVRRYLEAITAFRQSFPQLYAFFEKRSGDFNGFSILIGNRGGYLGVLKQFGDDGRPEIMFCSAEDVIGVLWAAERALAAGKWKVDKPRK